MDFKLIKAYYHNPYMGWTTHNPNGLCEWAYFIKIEGSYFMLGSLSNNKYIVNEVDDE